MEAFFSFMKLFVVVNGLLIALFLVLLSLKDSKLRGITLYVFGGIQYSLTGIWVLYILSPVDLIPDILPVIGQIDDAGALVMAVFSGITGIICTVQGRNSLKKIDDRQSARIKKLDTDDNIVE